MDDPTWLSAREAAARLGVKVETLYAYVSRGQLGRHPGPDGRTSAFDRAEVEALRDRRRRRERGGADSVIASAITLVTDEAFTYRGHPVVDLVAGGGGFEKAADLVLGAAATEAPWPDRPDPVQHGAALASLPTPAPLLDRLRIAAATASAHDPLRHDLSPVAVRRAARVIVVAMVDALPLRRPDGGPQRGRPHDADDRPTSIAERLWPRLATAAPTTNRLAALDAALVLLADHDLAASTYAARVAASTRADPYAVVGAGLGALGGTRHGAASRAVQDLIESAVAIGSPDVAVGEVLRRSARLPGTGHSVYQRVDPRFACLQPLVMKAFDDDHRRPLVERTVELVVERGDGPANVDLALGCLGALADMPHDGGEAVFAIARTIGWVAHALEEYDEAPLRYRPRSRYLGPRSPGARGGLEPGR